MLIQAVDRNRSTLIYDSSICDATASRISKIDVVKTDLAIADIASKVGFSSQSHLTQQFTAVFT
jgi:AraC-like DNA-binding protein